VLQTDSRLFKDQLAASSGAFAATGTTGGQWMASIVAFKTS
jgi:hypothetical protein